MKTAARRYADDFDESKSEWIVELLKQIDELIGTRAVILRQLSDADTKIKQKREAMLAIERVSIYFSQSRNRASRSEKGPASRWALRTIPKDVAKDENDDELLRALRGE